MNQFMIYGAVFFFIICVVGFFITMRVGRNEEYAKTENDQPVANAAKEHSLILNPVFITYAVAGIFCLVYIIYWMMKT